MGVSCAERLSFLVQVNAFVCSRVEDVGKTVIVFVGVFGGVAVVESLVTCKGLDILLFTIQCRKPGTLALG